MMIESSRESGRKLISGVADYARHFGPWQIHWQPQGVQGLAAPLADHQFDGLLVRDVAVVREFSSVGIPIVAFTYLTEGIDGTVVVDVDDKGIGEAIARNVLSRGFRHFAFCGQKGAPWARKRGACFDDVLKSSGYATDQLWIDLSSLDRKNDAEQLKNACEWLHSLPKPVAIMTANDDAGQWMVQACQSAGLRVPDDCSVIGVDNDPVVCGVCNPPLSSIAIDQYQAGYRAAAALDKLMRGEKPDDLKITAQVGELVIRQSSDIFAVEDVAVSKALRFMQENAHRPVTVDEIAQASGLFRRGLERRFRDQLGQSIQKRSRELRAAHLAKLIVETQMSLEEIAEESGFSQASHLTRFFVSVRGETPSEFRKRSHAQS